MSQKVLNKRSSALVNGEAKLPTSQQLDYGEIAINFASGHETLSIKNSSDEIATFSSDQYFKDIIEENEYITSMALNDINNRLVSSASQLVNDVGFITGYTETDPTVPTWAKQSTKPTYTANEVGALPTGTTLDNVPDGTTRKLSNYATSSNTYNAIANASGNIKSYVDSKVSSVYVYKGSVTNYSELASITTKEAGDVYNVVNANGSTPGGTNYAWTGTEWDALGGTIDLSNYVENSAFTAHTGNSAIHLTTSDVETQIENKLANYLPLSGGTMVGNSNIIIPTDSGTQSCEISPTSIAVVTTFGEDATIGQNYVIVSKNYGDEIADMRYNSLSFTKDDGVAMTATTYGIDNISAKGKTLTFPSKTGTFALTSDIPSTAAEIGALPTGTTLDNVQDGTTRKLSNYATQANFTAHTGNSAIHLTTGDVETQITSHNYLTGYTETDPTVPNWAKQTTKPSYTASEVGALPTGTTLDNVPDGTTRKLSNYTTQANFAAHTGDSSIHITTGDVKSQIEAYNYITGYTETDPTVPSWAKQSTKPSYTANEVGAMATSERSNYLPTGTTLDDVADGTTRKLSNYATQANFTAHTASTEIHVTAAQKSSWDSKVSNVQSDWNATTGLAAILNKPTIPSAPGTLNTTATASQSTNASQSLADNITLHKVSKTGSYNDLNNKPTIPTVNDNTITLTFNGATVGTFTLNQNSNKTIDIGTIIGLPSFSSANNGQILGVVNGQLTWVTPTTIYTGTGTPSASQGNDGDIYLQTS